MEKDGTVESVTAFIINYFQNDYLVIKDFLTSNPIKIIKRKIRYATQKIKDTEV